MFETTLESRRAGRIAFGTVLIFGAALMLLRVEDQARSGYDKGIHLVWIMLGSWAAAFIAGFVTSLFRVTNRGLRPASLVVPSIGVSLMLPLLMHLPFIAVSGDTAYDRWVALSIYAVGLAHVVLALLAGIRAWRLARGKRAMSIGVLYGLVVLASCIPFGMFIVPPLVTAITGLPFVAVLHYQATLATSDREAEGGEIPVAIARWRAIL
jgi:hypothetical protein